MINIGKLLLCGLLGAGISVAAAAKKTQINLAKNGKTLFVLLLPKQPLPTEQKAADELCYHLNKITGADFKIVNESDKKIHSPYISIGQTQAAQKARPEGWNKITTPASCGLTVKNGNIYLFGSKRRGPLFAAYMFLEEDLGCRWYGNGWNKIPSKPELTVELESRVETPAFPVFRDPLTFISNKSEFTLRNRGNGVFSGIPKPLGGFYASAAYKGKWWFAHTYNNILKSTPENLKKFPKCFMMDEHGKRIKDQLCPLSPMVQKLAVEEIIALMKHGTGAVNLSQNDSPVRCHCPECEAVIAREGTPAAPHLMLVNHVANAIKKAGINDREIMFLGYQQTRKPPKHMKMADNTAVWLCTDIQSQAKYIPVEKNSDFVANIKQWRKVVPRIYIWDYYVNFNNYFAYEPTLYSMAQNLKFYARNGVTGVMLQGAYQSPGAALEGISAWVFEKLLWNPEQPIEPLMHDYINGVYGPAAPAMEKLYLKVYEIGKSGREAPKDEIAFNRFEQSCLDEAKALLKKNHREDLLPRVEIASLPLMVRTINRKSIEYVKQGKPFPDSFKQYIADFERLAAKYKIKKYSECAMLKTWLERIRKRDGRKAKGWTKTVDYQGQPVEVEKLSSLWKLKALTLMTEHDKIQREAIKNAGDQVNVSGWDDFIDNMGVGWEAQGYPGFIGTGVFRNMIAVKNVEQYKHWYLFFGSVDCEAVIYINGKKAYDHTLKSTGKTIYNLWNHPFGFDAGHYLRNGSNSVAVICTNHGPAGGIYMPAFLVGSNQKLNRIELYKLTGSRHPYALDRSDEITKELKK